MYVKTYDNINIEKINLIWYHSSNFKNCNIEEESITEIERARDIYL